MKQVKFGPEMRVIHTQSGPRLARVVSHQQMGATQQPPTAPAPAPLPAPFNAPDGMVEVPAFYTCSVVLGEDEGDEASNSVALRPEQFGLRRITWATTGDVPPFVELPASSSVQGKAVELTWGDEFTKFFGEQPCLISACFGDSNGFLDLPGAGLLFQGRQSLNVKLKRLFYPTGGGTPSEMRFDFQFQGVGYLPANTGGVSGSL